MHWVSKVVEATVGAAERRADVEREYTIVRKTTTNRAGFRQIFNLRHVNERRQKQYRDRMRESSV